MSTKVTHAIATQRRHCTETAVRYDRIHVNEGDDEWNVQLVSALLRVIDARSILDVGAATGRGVQRLQSPAPDAFICGVEPVAALIDQGLAKRRDSRSRFVQASGDALPFADRSFDAVCSFAILHHVPRPATVIGEMLRVARYAPGLWPIVNFAKTHGKGDLVTEAMGWRIPAARLIPSIKSRNGLIG